MRFVATGDSFITRRLPSTHDKGFRHIMKIIHQGEFRFTNLEVTVHDFEGFPSAQSGGTWARAEPAVLNDIKQYGFNTLAWANNHTLDYSYGGLEATKKYIKERDFVHAGVGKHLAAAAAPKYIDCPSGRVAIIAATSTFHESWIAGEQRSDVEGRPGVNPLRYDTTHIVTKEQMEQLKEIAAVTNINAVHNLAIKEGFAVPYDDQAFRFGDHQFELGAKTGMHTKPSQIDMERISHTIEEAKSQADYVVVSIHTHEMEGEDKSKAPLFLKEFARNCIDRGAHAILGHGPHILRGIEVYQERPIFYSLGNFIFQNDTVTNLPHDFYATYDLGFEHNVVDALNKRSANGKKGLGVNPGVWESVIPSWKMKDGKLEEMTLYPIELGFDLPAYKRGWPKIAKTSHALENLQRLSEPFGTQIEIKDNIGSIKL